MFTNWYILEFVCVWSLHAVNVLIYYELNEHFFLSETTFSLTLSLLDMILTEEKEIIHKCSSFFVDKLLCNVNNLQNPDTSLFQLDLVSDH